MRTGNGYRASIMLEEVGLPYQVVETDVRPGVPRSDAFMACSPLGKIPAILDTDTADGRPVALAESLAIALYLSEKTGRLLPSTQAGRALAYQWGAIVSSGFGTAITGIFFARQIDAEAHAKLIDKYFGDIGLGFSAMDKHLSAHRYLAGKTYSYADVMALPLLATAQMLGHPVTTYPSVGRWYAEVSDRAAVRRGLAVPPAR